MDKSQLEDKITLEKAVRRAGLLAAAAEVSQHITQIIDIDNLLPRTVDIICNSYDFYYAGVFLVNEAGDFAVLRAGRGEPGRIMIENNHKLAVGGNSMIGACTALNEARISLDVDTEKVWYPNPVLPETRSEMALPLAIGNKVVGAVTVQSVEAAAFSEEDISSLQAMANQLAIALDNARQRKALDEAHEELLRAKTYEAIATATGDAIHWIGNKAEPIGGSIDRVRHDVKLFFIAIANILNQPEIMEKVEEQSIVQLILKEGAALQQNDPGMSAAVEKLNNFPLGKLEKRLSIHSTLDDLEIVEDSARLIMKVKEDLIGPAREHAPRPTMLDDVAKDAVSSVDIPPGIVTVSVADDLPLVLADPVQLNRVFVNLLNNGFEAMEGQAHPQIGLSLQSGDNDEFVTATVTDNGSGISEIDMDKIWITFHTTKGIKGHSGLGLPACRLILKQLGGNISAGSEVNHGTTFTINIPVYPGKEQDSGSEIKGAGSVLLIDDDDSWQELASIALTNAGFDVTVCDKDYSFAPPVQYDLILIDDILSNKDSLDILTALKADSVIKKVLVMSSNPRVDRTKQLMLLGIQDLLPKPYTQAALLEEIANAVS